MRGQSEEPEFARDVRICYLFSQGSTSLKKEEKEMGLKTAPGSPAEIGLL